LELLGVRRYPKVKKPLASISPGDDVILANQEKTSSAVDVGGTIERR
jgi:hypothetical protein